MEIFAKDDGGEGKTKTVKPQKQRDYIQAFFSMGVRSVQEPFMRSRRAIQSSACSCGGIVSHLFSTSTSIGLEMACVEAGRTAPAAKGRMAVRATAERSMVGEWTSISVGVSRDLRIDVVFVRTDTLRGEVLGLRNRMM